MKQHDPRGRASAALHCLRCGQPGRFAANCPVPAKTGTKRAATEAVAQLEAAHVTFLDFKGHERMLTQVPLHFSVDLALQDDTCSTWLRRDNAWKSGRGPIPWMQAQVPLWR